MTLFTIITMKHPSAKTDAAKNYKLYFILGNPEDPTSSANRRFPGYKIIGKNTFTLSDVRKLVMASLLKRNF